MNARDVCFVGLPVKSPGDTGAGDRLCRVLDELHRAHEPRRAPVCPGTPPRRGRPPSAAADSHARPAAWRNDIDAVSTVTAPPRGIMGPSSGSLFLRCPAGRTWFAVHGRTRRRVPTATGGRAAPVRLKRPAECPTLTADVAMSGRRVLVGHRASRRWRTGPIPRRGVDVRSHRSRNACTSGADAAAAPPDGGRRHGRNLINIGSRATVFNSPNRLVHNSFRELRVRHRILPEMLLGSSVVWTSAMTPLFKRRLSACAEAESTSATRGVLSQRRDPIGARPSR